MWLTTYLSFLACKAEVTIVTPYRIVRRIQCMNMCEVLRTAPGTG